MYYLSALWLSQLHYTLQSSLHICFYLCYAINSQPFSQPVCQLLTIGRQIEQGQNAQPHYQYMYVELTNNAPKTKIKV